ncbi:putative CDP-diacylglycerol pyrophosphatase [Burkholderiales bacterium]|nr:putative CDP-diacylglycerol pyrophosphatase [Burkholderiales bacterium]
MAVGVSRALATAARRAALALGWLLLLSIGLAGCARDAEPSDLAIWRIVDQGCNGGQHAPAPAVPEPAPHPTRGLQCETAQGIAVLKDRCGPTHFLVIPTARRSGVESPELLSAEEPNYFALAWEQRAASTAALSSAAPDKADIGLAINSRYGRSQAQLHIHIDLLRPQVRSALLALAQPLAADTRLELMGHWYRVDHLDSLAQSPFAQAAREWGAQTAEERARLTLAVVGDGGHGFFLLSDRADLTARDRGHAEELLVPHPCG